ncbi:MAG: DUF4403 family protein [Crocinitomicaceae bacterium]|nr:DUF4403 family protein [Crocinitomicaceae bacterium]
MNFKTSSFIITTIFFTILYSCGTIRPESPVNIISEEDIPAQPISSIKLPIKVNLAPYFKETDESIPLKFTGKEQQCEGVSFSYKFLRSPITFKGVGNKLLFDVDGKYALRVNYCAQCTGIFNEAGNCLVPRIYASCGVDEPMRTVHVGYATSIGVSKNYKLTSNTKLRKVKTLSPCEMTMFSYDASKTLEEELTIALQDVEKDIDSEIEAIDLKPTMEEVWEILCLPTDLEGYGFLSMHPKDISLSKIHFKGDTAYVNALLHASPNITLNNKDTLITKLPPLSEFKNQDGFDITMDINAKYDSLSSMLSSNIKGKSIDINGNEVIFGDINIHGAANKKVNLRVDFTGKKKGTLYLTGTPIFHRAKQNISFPDLNFDVKTKHALLKSAKWLYNKKITNMIRDLASMDLKPYLDSLKGSLNENINMELDEGIFMSGKVNDIKIGSIIPLENKLFLRFHSLGELKLTM